MGNPLSILMVSTSYPKSLTDWRGLFIRHLVDGLASTPGVNLSLWAPPGELSDTVNYACSPRESAWLDQLMGKGGIAHILRKRNLTSITFPIKLLWMLRKTYKRHTHQNILHINWLQNALPLCCISGRRSVLISVLGTDMGLLDFPGMRLLLRKIFRQHRCVLAPNADWMIPKLQEYFGDLVKVRGVPFGIDNRWYSVNRSWQESPRKWLVVSRLTRNKIGPLFHWGEALFKGEDELHLFGPMQESLEVPDWIHYHGPTHPKELLEEWFPRATGLISLSLHNEGRPQVMLEAMAAGVPIIASHLPAHDNLLSHRNTGWLTDSREDFADALAYLSVPAHNQSMGDAARHWVKSEFGTWADCAGRYLQAYHDLLEPSR